MGCATGIWIIFHRVRCTLCATYPAVDFIFAWASPLPSNRVRQCESLEVWDGNESEPTFSFINRLINANEGWPRQQSINELGINFAYMVVPRNYNSGIYRLASLHWVPAQKWSADFLSPQCRIPPDTCVYTWCSWNLPWDYTGSTKIQSPKPPYFNSSIAWWSKNCILYITCRHDWFRNPIRLPQ